MKNILDQLYRHKALSRQQAQEVLFDIATGAVAEAQIASFLTAFIMRPITLEELTGFREALLKLSLPVALPGVKCMDVCGTGGDGKHTFNISTLVAFVIAGAGVPVAKHGNYGVSSVSGSSNVLAAHGILFSDRQEILQRQIKEAGICFLHAPLFHPAMKAVAPARKALGVKTFFNMLGPLVNPAKPSVQMNGVFNLELARIYQYLLQQEGIQFSVVHTLDGYDEVSLTAPVRWIRHNGEKWLEPSDLSPMTIQPKDLYGGDSAEAAAQTFINILQAQGTPQQHEVVIVNAALALQTYHDKLSYPDARHIAESALFQGSAFQCFQRLKAIV